MERDETKLICDCCDCEIVIMRPDSKVRGDSCPECNYGFLDHPYVLKSKPENAK